MLQKCPSRIQWRDSNPQPPQYESPLITTRSGPWKSRFDARYSPEVGRIQCMGSSRGWRRKWWQTSFWPSWLWPLEWGRVMTLALTRPRLRGLQHFCHGPETGFVSQLSWSFIHPMILSLKWKVLFRWCLKNWNSLIICFNFCQNHNSNFSYWVQGVFLPVEHYIYLLCTC